MKPTDISERGLERPTTACSDALFREALLAFIRQQAARRLAALAGQAPEMADIPRRRPEAHDE